MEIQKMKAIIEAILFAAGRVVSQEELMIALEIDKKQLEELMDTIRKDYDMRGIEIIKVENGYQLCTKKEYYEYIVHI